MTESPLEIITDLCEALRVMTVVFPVRSGEPSCDMYVEVKAHEKAEAALNSAATFTRDFYQRKSESSVIRYYPGIDQDGTVPRATMAPSVTGDYVRYDDYDEERNIVNRIWSMFGNPAYEFLDGKSIYDLVQDGLAAIQLLGRYREGHRQSSGQECYVDIEQGDYRCSNCIEADRLTGIERALRKMADERMAKVRASLAEPYNGFISPAEANRKGE